MLMKIVVVLLFITVLVSLSSGLVYLVRDKGRTDRTVKALSIRIGISIFAFLLLMLGHYVGWIQPHGIVPQ